MGVSLLGESGSDAGSGPPFNLMLPNFDDAEVDGELSGSPDSSTENRRPSHMGEGFAGLPQVRLQGTCTCNGAAAKFDGRLKLQPARQGLSSTEAIILVPQGSCKSQLQQSLP